MKKITEGMLIERMYKPRLQSENIPKSNWRAMAIKWEQERIRRDFPGSEKEMPHLFEHSYVLFD